MLSLNKKTMNYCWPFLCLGEVKNIALFFFDAKPEGRGGVAIVIKRFVSSLSQRPNETFTVCQCRSFNQFSIY
jgi:hypothetical protein